MYKVRLKDHKGVLVAFCAPSIREGIRIALAWDAVSMSIKLHGEIVYSLTNTI